MTGPSLVTGSRFAAPHLHPRRAGHHTYRTAEQMPLYPPGDSRGRWGIGTTYPFYLNGSFEEPLKFTAPTLHHGGRKSAREAMDSRRGVVARVQSKGAP